MNRVLHLVRYSRFADDGGKVRDNAFYFHFLKTHGAKTISLTGNRLFNLIKALSCLFRRRQTVLLHMTSMGFPIMNNGIVGKIAATLLVSWMAILLKRHRIVLEVNDLYVDQAKDLDLAVPVNYARIERWLFTRVNLTYAFASDSMRVFASRKYQIPRDNGITVINGEHDPPQKSIGTALPAVLAGDRRIKCIYAGTLNKGRQIEEMIQAYRKSECLLILLGRAGEWIPQAYPGMKNLFYLGAFESQIARTIVSECDIGLIPYTEARPYYNIAYPTKLSSYLVAGIPVLSTGVREVKTIFRKHKGIGKSLPIHDWPAWLNRLKTSEIGKMKKQVALVKSEFTWKKILDTFENQISENQF